MQDNPNHPLPQITYENCFIASRSQNFPLLLIGPWFNLQLEFF